MWFNKTALQLEELEVRLGMVSKLLRELMQEHYAVENIEDHQEVYYYKQPVVVRKIGRIWCVLMLADDLEIIRGTKKYVLEHLRYGKYTTVPIERI